MKTQNSNEVLDLGINQSAAPAKFNKAKDIRGHEISGVWERNGRYYLQLSLLGNRRAEHRLRRF